jgi:hypothetical protein
MIMYKVYLGIDGAWVLEHGNVHYPNQAVMLTRELSADLGLPAMAVDDLGKTVAFFNGEFTHLFPGAYRSQEPYHYFLRRDCQYGQGADNIRCVI